MRCAEVEATHTPKHKPRHWTQGTAAHSTPSSVLYHGVRPGLRVSTLPRSGLCLLELQGGQLLAFFGVHFAGDTNRTLPLEVLGPSPCPPVCLCDIGNIPVPAMLASFQAHSPGAWSSSLWPPNVPSLPSQSPCRPDHTMLSCPGFLESPQPPHTLRMAAPRWDPGSQMIRGPERLTRIAGSHGMQSVPAFQRVGPLIPLHGRVGEGARAREARQLASNGVVPRLVQLPL